VRSSSISSRSRESFSSVASLIAIARADDAVFAVFSSAFTAHRCSVKMFVAEHPVVDVGVVMVVDVTVVVEVVVAVVVDVIVVLVVDVIVMMVFVEIVDVVLVVVVVIDVVVVVVVVIVVMLVIVVVIVVAVVVVVSEVVVVLFPGCLYVLMMNQLPHMPWLAQSMGPPEPFDKQLLSSLPPQ